MKQGTHGTLSQLAAEIEQRAHSRKDFIAEPKTMSIDHDGEGVPNIVFAQPGLGQHHNPMKDLALRQMLNRLDIPAAYYRKTLSRYPELLRANTNYLLERHEKPFMVRTRLDGNRVVNDALLSNAYKRIDNAPVAEAILPILADANVEFQSMDVTDNKMYIKVVSPRFQAEPKVGDPVQLGLVVSNSEVGLGFLSIQTMIYTLACTNGMIVPKEIDSGIRMAHRGSRNDSIGIIYSDNTIRLQLEASMSALRDTVGQVFSDQNFNRIITTLSESTERKIVGDVPAAVKELGKVVSFNEEEGSGILRHLIEGGDISQYGMLNAVTRFSQEEALSYDRSTELEIAGGKVLELSPRQWKNISEAEAA